MNRPASSNKNTQNFLKLGGGQIVVDQSYLELRKEDENLNKFALKNFRRKFEIENDGQDVNRNRSIKRKNFFVRRDKLKTKNPKKKFLKITSPLKNEKNIKNPNNFSLNLKNQKHKAKKNQSGISIKNLDFLSFLSSKKRAASKHKSAERRDLIQLKIKAENQVEKKDKIRDRYRKKYTKRKRKVSEPVNLKNFMKNIFPSMVMNLCIMTI